MAVKRRPPARRSAIRINPKFYVFLGIVAAIVIAIVFFITNVNTAVVEQGEIMFEKALPVVVVRDEQVISATSYGKPNYLVQEGERVEAGASVADIYNCLLYTSCGGTGIYSGYAEEEQTERSL